LFIETTLKYFIITQIEEFIYHGNLLLKVNKFNIVDIYEVNL